MLGDMSISDLYQPPDMREREITGEQSLLSTVNKFVQAVNGMDETVMIPSKLMDMPANLTSTKNSKDLLPIKSNNNQGDLYSFYTMLNAIKSELVGGPKSDEELQADEEDDNETEKTEADLRAKQTAAMFRHHLKGLFTVLNNLTDIADHLTVQYQDDIGEYSSRSRMAPKVLL